MNSNYVDLHPPGADGTPESGSTQPLARLVALGYTYTTTGGARR
jgi:hypothetical protein